MPLLKSTLVLNRTAQAAEGTSGLVDDFNKMVDNFAEFVEKMVRATGRQRCTDTRKRCRQVVLRSISSSSNVIGSFHIYYRTQFWLFAARWLL